jgi:hypothetical protein
VELFHDIPKISCPENNAQIFIGKENYFLSADGFSYARKEGSTAAGLRYFTHLESNDNVRILRYRIPSLKRKALRKSGRSQN